jgi:hypothetical protein
MKVIAINKKESILDRFYKLQIGKAAVLLLIPLVLNLKSGEWLSSISAYYYSNARDEFVILLTLAGLLYANDGILKSKWWNISIGASLIGVAYFPHLDYSFLHYLFAGYFFLGTSFSMIFFSSKKQRNYKILVTVFILLFMALHFFFNVFSLLVAEWLCMIPMALHFIGESTGKID